MYHVEKKWLTGYVMLPCFKARALDGTDGAELTCGPIASWLFEYIFSNFWDGTMVVTGEEIE